MTPPIPPFCFDFTYGFDDIRNCLPQTLRELAARSEDIFGLAPETVAACGLAHLAAAGGHSSMMDDGTALKPPGFNFVAVSDQMYTGDLVSCMGRGWIEYAGRLGANPRKAQNAVQKLAKCIHQSEPTGIAPRRADQQALDAQPVEQMSTMVSAQLLNKLITRSPDRSATLIQGAGDPIEEWSRLRPDVQGLLSSLLRLSWHGKNMKPCPRSPAIRASLHCLWQTQPASLKKVFFNSRSRALDNPPPLLLHRVQGKLRRFPNKEAPELAAWHQRLGMIFAMRFISPAREDSLEYDGIAENYSQQVIEAMQYVPDLLHPWLDWTPDLLPKMYNLLLNDWHLTEAQSGRGNASAPPDKAPLQVREEMMYKSAILTTWMLQEHRCALEKLLEESLFKVLPDIPDFTDIELPWAILDRLRDHGPLSRRDLQRLFHRLAAKDRDEALKYLVSKGEIVETQDGKLARAA